MCSIKDIIKGEHTYLINISQIYFTMFVRTQHKFIFPLKLFKISGFMLSHLLKEFLEI